jgi:hypothetical protein
MRLSQAHLDAIDTAIGIAFDYELDEYQQSIYDRAKEAREMLRVIVDFSTDGSHVVMQQLRDLKQQVTERWLESAMVYDAGR